jgi:hypothetical protein
VHKTREVKDLYKELKITAIFNVPYSPDFNGIESYFSLVKSAYKKLILQQIMKGERFSPELLIHEAVLRI